MKENKKIDDLFKSKIPRDEVVPPGEVWENISAQLSSERKYRSLIIPLWFKVAGVAAVFLLILLTFPFTDEPNNAPAISEKPVEDEQNQEENFTTRSDPNETAISNSKSDNVPENVITETKSTPEASGNQKEGQNIPGLIRNINNRLRVEPIRISSKSARVDPIILASAPLIGMTHFPELQKIQKELNKENEIADESFEDDLKNEALKDRFSVTPTVAAIYSGKIGNGHTVDDNFSDNSTSGNINMAYGISLAYRLSKKVKIRSGINNITMSSTTQNVDNVTAVNSSALIGDPAGNMYIPQGVGSLNQHLSFLEIPIELEHALVEKKLGINLIMGASTYLLQGNEIELKSANINAQLGPSNNINNTSFSANLGFGFSYQLSSRLHFNLDPIIKYQINTYENVSDLKPYNVGVYSGLRFKL